MFKGILVATTSRHRFSEKTTKMMTPDQTRETNKNPCSISLLWADGWLLVCMLLIATGLSYGRGGGKEMAGGFTWQTASLESQGMSSSRLNAMRDVLADRGSKSFLVVRNDKIVYEWYAPDHTYSWSSFRLSEMKEGKGS